MKYAVKSSPFFFQQNSVTTCSGEAVVHSKEDVAGILKGMNLKELKEGNPSGLLSGSLLYPVLQTCVVFFFIIPTSQNSMSSSFLCSHNLHITVSLTAPSGQFSSTSSSLPGLLTLLIPAAEQKAVCFVAFSEAMQKLLLRQPPTLLLTGQPFLLNPLRANQPNGDGCLSIMNSVNVATSLPP